MGSRLRFQEGKQRAFLRDFFSLSGGNASAICRELGIPRNTFKKWLDESRLLPEGVYSRLVGLQPSITAYSSFILEKKPRTWGRALGGQHSIASIKAKYGESELKRRQRNGGRKSIDARLAKLRGKLPPASHALYEFLGAMMGDGWIGIYGGRKQVNICGNLRDEKQYMGHLRGLIRRLFGVSSHLKFRPRENVFYLMMNSSVIFDFFREKFDFPAGPKDRFNTSRLPARWEYQKDVIRGIFDTDGCFYFDKSNSYKYPYPTIDITSKNSELLSWVGNCLSQNGFTVFYGYRSIRLKGRENLEKWFGEIKPSNQKHWRKCKRHSSMLGPYIAFDGIGKRSLDSAALS